MIALFIGMNKKIGEILRVLCFMCSYSVLCIFQALGQDIDVVSQLSDDSGLQTRLVFDWQAARLFFMDERDDMELVMPRTGFSSLFLSFGPVRMKGLLREVSNPLGFTPTSVVFDEPTTLVPDSSFGCSKTDFFIINPIPNVFSVFSTWKENALDRAGCIVSFTEKGKPFFELIASFTPRVFPEQKAEWFLESPEYLGGDIIHIGGRGVFAFDESLFHASFVSSGNDYYKPGYFVQGGFTIPFKPATLQALFGYCSDTYMTTERSFVDRMIDCDALLTIEQSRDLGFRLGYGTEIGRPRMGMSAFIPHKEHYTVGMERAFPLEAEGYLSVSSTASYGHDIDREGKEEHMCKIDFSVEADTGSVKLESGMDAEILNFAGIDADTHCSISVNAGSHTFSVSGSLAMLPDIDFSLKCSYDYSFDLSRVFISLRTEKPYDFTPDSWSGFAENPFDFMSLSIGFETRKKEI